MKPSTLFRSLALATAFALPLALVPVARAAEPVFLSVQVGPPALPVYAQPLCPGDGYLWTPGYWAWDDASGYYWVPGVWVLPPQPGLLWTPGYWAWDDDTQAYDWNEGYWAPEVGFYGGINYGFGYFGTGFDGGYWQNGFFFYNTRVLRVGYGFGHVYDRPFVIANHTTVSFNGGHGGIDVRPTPRELAFAHQQHFNPTPNQLSHQNVAHQNPSQFNNNNHGHPTVPAAASVNSFHDHPNDPDAAAHPGNGGNQPNRFNGNRGTFNQPQPNNDNRPGNLQPRYDHQAPQNAPQPQQHSQPQTQQHPQPQTQQHSQSHPAPPPHNDDKK